MVRSEPMCMGPLNRSGTEPARGSVLAALVVSGMAVTFGAVGLGSCPLGWQRLGWFRSDLSDSFGEWACLIPH